jgi:hypothetical protein
MTKPRCAGLAFLATFLGLPFDGAAQTPAYVTLHSTNIVTNLTPGPGVNYAVQTNQIVSVVGYDWTHSPLLYGNFADGTQVNLNLSYTSSPGTSETYITTGSKIPQITTGLTNIIMQPDNGFNVPNVGFSYYPTWATFQITTLTAPLLSQIMSQRMLLSFHRVQLEMFKLYLSRVRI